MGTVAILKCFAPKLRSWAGLPRTSSKHMHFYSNSVLLTGNYDAEGTAEIFLIYYSIKAWNLQQHACVILISKNQKGKHVYGTGINKPSFYPDAMFVFFLFLFFCNLCARYFPSA